jgi:hypothetical protein
MSNSEILGGAGLNGARVQAQEGMEEFINMHYNYILTHTPILSSSERSSALPLTFNAIEMF